MYHDNSEIVGSSNMLPAPNLLIHPIDIPTTEEFEQQLASYNATEVFKNKTASISKLIELQAARTGDAVALVVGGQTLQYEELNRRANQLAHHLRNLGVGPEVLVGLCVERSFEMVIGMLGILKAGGAYLPLDPTYPVERLNFMLEDAQVPVLVTRQHLTFHTEKTHIVYLDTDAAFLAMQKSGNLDSTFAPTDLAYVIYTSGSTGRPKGVQITHDSLLNLVFWHRDAYGITSSDRATQVTSPAFDATGWELWPYLTAGASVYLPDDETRISPVLLWDWLEKHHITVTFLPTSLAETILTLEWSENTSLRLLLTGADRLHRYPPSTLPFKFINNYGPTEATVVATSGQILPTEHATDFPSIGRPIANTQIYILDDHMQSVPIGVAGELYIGGAGLGRGYLNRQELTAERFIPHPFSDKPGARIYKTGDTARYLSDGQIAFVGRIDHQIKIRGHRIEPGEIVAVLNHHPAIQTSYVIARDDGTDDKRLVAYIILMNGARVTGNSLREALLISLPEYMIPVSFVVLDILPLTSNGKVDLDAFPSPTAANVLSDEVITLPTSLTEQQVAKIACKLLRIEQIDIDANFFLLGGHSLLGTQLVARIAQTFGITIPLRTLFEAPTIRTLSGQIEQRIRAKVQQMSDDEVQRLLM